MRPAFCDPTLEEACDQCISLHLSEDTTVFRDVFDHTIDCDCSCHYVPFDCGVDL